MGLLLLLWPAILIVLGAHSCSSLLMGNDGQAEGHNANQGGNSNRSLAVQGAMTFYSNN